MYRIVLFIITCFLTLPSCSQEAQPQPKEVIQYLALGDSYTIGQGVEEKERWPNQLSEQLNSSGFEVKSTEIIARTGWTTANLIDGIASSDLGEYNLVSLLIGVNNQFQGKPFEQFTTEFEELLETAIGLAGSKGRVFLVSIPDYGVTPFGSANKEKIGLELDQYNGHMEKRASEEGIPFVNITEISRELGDSEGALASDNLHPSGEQYKQWTELILPTVISLFQKN